MRSFFNAIWCSPLAFAWKTENPFGADTCGIRDINTIMCIPFSEREYPTDYNSTRMEIEVDNLNLVYNAVALSYSLFWFF